MCMFVDFLLTALTLGAVFVMPACVRRMVGAHRTLRSAIRITQNNFPYIKTNDQPIKIISCIKNSELSRNVCIYV